MLSITLRIFIAFEILFYATIARYYFDASALGAGLLTLYCMLAARAMIVASTYVIARRTPSPAWPLTVLQTLRMVLAEYAAFIACFLLIIPFEKWWMGADRLKPGNDRPPLLLIHGYGCSRGAWWWLRRRLEATGWTVATISLEPIYASIDHYIDPLARRIDAVLKQTGAPQLILVGHSMGGLLGRAYCKRHGVQRVACLITLGTPHAGSELARLGMGENARQMIPGSPWLKALAHQTTLPETIVIYSRHDNYVLPASNQELPGAINKPINALGHLAMLFSPRIGNALLEALEKRQVR